MEFLERFKELLDENQLTISDVAVRTGLPRSTVSSYINRKSSPSILQLKALASLFDVSVDYLIGRTESDERQIDFYKNAFYTSSEEQELIKAYRQLSFDQQQVIKVQLGALVEVNK